MRRTVLAILSVCLFVLLIIVTIEGVQGNLENKPYILVILIINAICVIVAQYLNEQYKAKLLYEKMLREDK